MRLVDVDELLKKVDEEREHLKLRGQLGAEHVLVHNFRNLIESAPTVEQEVYMTGKDYDLYIKGYKQGKKDFKRPEGKWIVITEYDGFVHAKCDQCGKFNDMCETNFCPNCGASMVGGDENETD